MASLPDKGLKQPGFAYSTCVPFTKNKERIQQFKETGDAKYISKNELDKSCFQHDMGYGNFKDLARRTAADKSLRDKAFNIAKDPKYDGYQRRIGSMFYNFFDRKSALLPDKSVSGSGVYTQAKLVQRTYANDKIKQIQRPLDLATH